MNNSTAFSFFIGWSVIIVAFWGATKFEGSKTVLYFTLWLAVLLTIVAHYQEIIQIVTGAGLPEVATNPVEQRGRQP